MTNDSPFPPGVWHRLAESGDLCEALEQYRSFQQAVAQDTAWARHVRTLQRRQQRKAAARPDTVSLEAHR